MGFLRSFVRIFVNLLLSSWSGSIPREHGAEYGRRLPPVRVTLDDVDYVLEVLARELGGERPYLVYGKLRFDSSVNLEERSDGDSWSTEIVAPELGCSVTFGQDAWVSTTKADDIEVRRLVDHIHLFLGRKRSNVPRRLSAVYYGSLMIFFAAVIYHQVEPGGSAGLVVLLLLVPTWIVLVTSWRRQPVVLEMSRYGKMRQLELEHDTQKRQHRRELVILVIGLVLGTILGIAQDVGTDLVHSWIP